MRNLAQYTLLFLLCGLAGFGITVVAANGPELANYLVAEETGSTELLAENPVEFTGSPASQDSGNDLATDLQESVLAPALQEAILGQLSAVGVIELIRDRQVVLAASGRVDEVAVEVGDRVQAGDLLVSLDTTYLDWAVEQAEIGFQTARIDFEELGETIQESDIAVAEADLLLAQEQLAEVEAGPTEEELAAARSSVAAAWAGYEELQEEPTQAQINQALAGLKSAEIDLQAAQREFDKIAWLPEAAATSAADELQRATVAYEAAQASFQEVNQPASESELQTALSAAQSAQAALNELLKQPTPAALAGARAAVAAAQDALEDAQEGALASELKKAELAVRQALISLEEQRLALANAEVEAPIDGTVLEVNVDLGQQASAGDVAAVLADTSDVRLVVNVEQKDIRNVTVGQAVDISVFALPDEQFVGTVDKIAPTSTSGTGFVTFPVLIRLTDGPLDRLLPGMTASANFVMGDEGAAADEEATDSPAAEDTEAEDTEAEAPDTVPEEPDTTDTDAPVDDDAGDEGAGEVDAVGEEEESSSVEEDASDAETDAAEATPTAESSGD